MEVFVHEVLDSRSSQIFQGPLDRGYEPPAATSRKAAVAPLHQDDGKAFIVTVPTGRWTAYVDVATDGGSPKGAMGVGAWLMSKGDDVPTVYRALNRKGEVSQGFKSVNPALPPDPVGVRVLLEREGVHFDGDGRADPGQRWTVEDWGPVAEVPDTDSAPPHDTEE